MFKPNFWKNKSYYINYMNIKILVICIHNVYNNSKVNVAYLVHKEVRVRHLYFSLFFVCSVFLIMYFNSWSERMAYLFIYIFKQQEYYSILW